MRGDMEGSASFNLTLAEHSPALVYTPSREADDKVVGEDGTLNIPLILDRCCYAIRL